MTPPVRRPGAAVNLSALLLLMTLNTANARPPVVTDPSAVDPAGRVLDIERLRIVASHPLPSDAGPTCDVLVIGGGTGGVAAAEAAMRQGYSVILTEPTSALGGQFTSQLVSTPDENSYIERDPGPSTRAYRALRERVRAHYAAVPGILPGKAANVGQCWVSRISATPDIWEHAIDDRFSELAAAGAHPLRTYLRHQLRNVSLLANGRVNYADLVDLDTGKVTRIGARYLLDATEDGSGLAICGLPTTFGQEAQTDFNEPHAPPDSHPEWVQSFTYCFTVRWQDAAGQPTRAVAPPDEYAAFKALGVYSLDYEYIDRGIVPYTMLTTAPGAAGSFWAYRRLNAASSYNGGHSPINDIALINWRGNDFHEEYYLGKPLDDQLRILQRGREFARGFLYYLQTECPRDDGGIGYPEIQPIGDPALPDVEPDGLAVAPYVRESRRLKAKFTLNENHFVSEDPTAKWGETFPDSVGCSLYAIDVHPALGEPPLLVKALPAHIPLGSFLTTVGPTNVLPAAKNIGATRLAMASARMHPTEWLIGEVSGTLAAFCIAHDIDDPAQVRDDPALLAAFQSQLHTNGVTLSWADILTDKTDK